MIVRMRDTGRGPVVVLVPGVQGRWEWMRPAVDALARHCRVITFSLCGEPGSRCEATGGFERYARQIDMALAQAQVDAAAICGISFGGLIGLYYAARRPDRVRALALVSTPGPRWRPDRRQQRYLAHPRLMAPVFAAGAPFRLWPEVAAALPDVRDRLRFVIRHTARVATAPIVPALMAERICLSQTVAFERECQAIDAPTLVVTGEPRLDRIVPPESTAEYVHLIRGACAATMERTGHIGLVTRPRQFGELIGDFVERVASGPRTREALHA